MQSVKSSRRRRVVKFKTFVPIVALALSVLVASGCKESADSRVSDFDSGTSGSTIEKSESGLAIDGGADYADGSTATVPGKSVVPAPAAFGHGSSSSALPPTQLGIGDKSPGIAVAKWVKGEAVSEPLRGRVHVVEFWATWCGPCRTGMPHLTELQKEYAEDVTFIGVTNEDAATVEGFLAAQATEEKTWDDVIGYRLAIDDEGWTNTAYMRAAGRSGIPCAFVVGRDGVVEWIGHPAVMDEPLEKIVEGSWDRQAAITEYKLQQQLDKALADVGQSLRAKDWDAAVARLDQLEEEVGESDKTLLYRLRVLEIAGRKTEAAKIRGELIDSAWDDASMLDQVAWTAATDGDASNLDVALKAAKRASELREGKDAGILDTLARCYFELGDLEEAIKWQRQAVEYAKGQPKLEETLNDYLKAHADASNGDADASKGDADALNGDAEAQQPDATTDATARGSEPDEP